MTTIRTILTRALAAAALLAMAPAPARAHPGEGAAGVLHDLLHGFALSPGHELRAVGLLVALLGATVLLGASRARGAERRGPLATAGSTALLAGLALTLA